MVASCVASMLRFPQSEGVTSHRDVVRHIGVRFRVKADLPEWYTDEDITNYFIRCGHYLLQLHGVHVSPFIATLESTSVFT